MTGRILPIQLIVVDVISRTIASVVITPIIVPVNVSSFFVAILIVCVRCAIISVIFIVIRAIAHIAISAASLILVVIGLIFRLSVYSRILLFLGSLLR